MQFFLFYFQEENAYNCISTLLSARHKVFLTQTKSQWDVAYITAMHLTKKFSVSRTKDSYYYLLGTQFSEVCAIFFVCLSVRPTSIQPIMLFEQNLIRFLQKGSLWRSLRMRFSLKIYSLTMADREMFWKCKIELYLFSWSLPFELISKFSNAFKWSNVSSLCHHFCKFTRLINIIKLFSTTKKDDYGQSTYFFCWRQFFIKSSRLKT